MSAIDKIHTEWPPMLIFRRGVALPLALAPITPPMKLVVRYHKSLKKIKVLPDTHVFFNSFDRQLCEVLAEDLTVELEERELDLKARAGLRRAKCLEKKQAKAEKRAKRGRDSAEKRKGKRWSIH